MVNKDSIEENRTGAVILAGGDSKRLGRPKALLTYGEKTLIEHMVSHLGAMFSEITIVTDRQELYSHLPVKLASDLIGQKEKSPLRGIHAGLSASDLPYQFFAACDMPMLNLQLIAYMSRYAPAYDAVVPCVGTYYQPLHAFYSRRCIQEIENVFTSGNFKVTSFYEQVAIRRIEEEEIARFDPAQLSFTNINTWKDYEALLGLRAEVCPGTEK